MLTLFHKTNTTAAAAILRNGFRDARGSCGPDIALAGVRLSDRPLDANEGANGECLLSVVGLGVTDLADYEVIEDGKPYREWCVPAQMINGRAIVTLLER